MSFSDHSRRLDDAVMIHLGDGLCTYQARAGVIPGATHMLDRDFEVYGEDQVAMRVTTISVRCTEVTKSAQGDRVVTPSRAWTVQQVLEDDGHWRRLWVS